MTGVSDSDWERISAYHDGELSASEMRSMAARIRAEPELAAALDEIRAVARNLGALRPALEPGAAGRGTIPAKHARRPLGWVVAGALAASIAIAGVLGPELLRAPTAFEIHAAFSGERFATAGGAPIRLAAARIAGAPDLSAARLSPVAVRSWEGGEAIHYAGRHGCRLTYLRGTFAMDNGVSRSGRQVAAWAAADDVQQMIVATGMDQAKFDAIAAYLKRVTGQGDGARMMAALAERTASAGRCVG